MAKGKTNGWVGSEWSTGTKTAYTSYVGIDGGCCQGACTTDTKVDIKDAEGKIVETKRPDPRLPVAFVAPTEHSLKPEARKALKAAGLSDSDIRKRLVFGCKNIAQNIAARKWRGLYTGDGTAPLKADIAERMDVLFDEDKMAEAKDLNAAVREAGDNREALQAIVDGFEAE